MASGILLVQLSLLVCVLLFTVSEGKRKGRDYTAYCGACKAVIDELKYSVDKEDPHKTLESGNFRVGSDGKQKGVRAKRYAGSETHLAELLEKVCGLMQNYGETTDPKTGEKGFMRINSRAGETITISNVNFSSGGTQELKSACEYFISEYEDEIILLFQDGLSQKKLEAELCHDITGYCSSKGSRTEL